jgi:hypothetical protein
VPQIIRFSVPPDVEAGVYANFVSLWHQPDSFVLDFSVFTAPPQLKEHEDGHQFFDLPARIVSRVRIPPQQVFELMKALGIELSAWERATGQSPSTPDT